MGKGVREAIMGPDISSETLEDENRQEKEEWGVTDPEGNTQSGEIACLI